MKSIIIPVLFFVFTMAITPGPNNMLLTASGARYGYRKTLELLIGMLLGMMSQLVVCAAGLCYLFEQFPVLQTILKVVGTLYLLYLAVKISFSRSSSDASFLNEASLSLYHGLFLQYLNPKAYIMALTAVSVYSLKGRLYIPSIVLIAVLYVIVIFPSISLWACFGSLLNGWMENKTKKKIVSYFLGGLTALSVIFIII